ncbi:wall-associated kinase family protein [Artemisia annua]|uniref:Wall-associated kinase family protein n=1 Tax=Artemisia annua TaxID=35608 RepID=A0A2U1PPM6_ARTAN|nr:wall-associated kinase family protein [Artemisia annua]
MKLLQAYHILLLVVTFLSLTATSIEALNFAKPGCIDTCGKVRIPYPFGIGANCSVNKWYTIDCKSSTPYLSALNNLEVVGVDLENQTISVNMQKLSACSQTTKSVNLASSPFLYSKSHNKFVVEGCGNGVILGDHGSVLTGCSTTCSNHPTTNTAVNINTNNTCFGINCCETTIPHHLNSYSMILTGLEWLDGDRACGSVFLVDKNLYDEVSNHPTTNTAVNINTNNTCFGINCCETTIPHHLNSYSMILTGLEWLDGDRACGSVFLVDKNLYDEVRFSAKSFIPTSLLWTLGYLDLKQRDCCYTTKMGKRTVDLSNGTSVDTLKCWSYYYPLNGNPYLFDGCEDTEECARCMGNGTGYCDYERIYDVDGLFNKWNLTCHTWTHEETDADSRVPDVVITIGNAYFLGL